MKLYTERNNMRKPIEHTSTMTIEIYALLFDCCEKYYDYIAWKFPVPCNDGYNCCGMDNEKLNNNLKFDIPTLYRNWRGISRPSDEEMEYDQYALLDFIEFIANNMKDISRRSWHDFFKHDHLYFGETNEIFDEFRKDINDIFKKTGLLFILTKDKIIERVLEHNIITPKIKNAIKKVKEPGTKELLEEAITLFMQPDPKERGDAVEKIWDALERLKTYYTAFDKRVSVEKIIKNMSSGQSEFKELFDVEFRALTAIGNSFRIRHHETDKIDIADQRHDDYFFNRCLSLVSLAIQYLK